MQRTVIEPQEKSETVKFSCSATEKAMFRISSSNNCYIDDVTLFYNDPNGIEVNAVEAVKLAHEPQFTVTKSGN